MRTHLLLASTLLATAVAAQNTRWAPVERALGRAGAMNPGDVYKFSFPRSDLTVTLDSVTLKPALALGTWVAFRDVDRMSMVMGDLVLLEKEIAPVMLALQRGGLEPTALHNHLTGETPHVMYMHIAGHGDAVALATTIHDALALTGTPMQPSAAAPPASVDLDTAAIARALGAAGKINGGVYQVAIPRRETIREHMHEVPPAMGVATAINFQPLGGKRAAVTGDFVLLPDEVTRVMLMLRAYGIAVTAVHSHMVGEDPRLLFMHFWATGPAVALASELGEALKAQEAR